MRYTFAFLLVVACGTTPNHPAVLGDCSSQPCSVPHNGATTSGPRADAGTDGAVVMDGSVTDTGVVIDTGVVDSGTPQEASMGDSP